MFDGKLKAITFSYDDGTTQDIRLIEILNKYGLKATFNLNSGLMGRQDVLERNGAEILHHKIKAEDIRYVYEGHEVAVHTLTHPNLTMIDDEKEIIRQVAEDKENLSELVKYEVCGMAYPCASPNCNDYVAKLIKDNTNIKYARTTRVTESFEPYNDLFQYRGTIHHIRDIDLLFRLGNKFIEMVPETPRVFYIWGHSFEFDMIPGSWKKFEDFCKMVSNRPEIFYGTNIEVL